MNSMERRLSELGKAWRSLGFPVSRVPGPAALAMARSWPGHGHGQANAGAGVGIGLKGGFHNLTKEKTINQPKVILISRK